MPEKTPDYYEMSIDETYKFAGRDQQRYRGEHTEKTFKTLQEVRDYLKKTYRCTRQKMYIDTKTGETKHIGWVYHFKDTQYDDRAGKWLTLYIEHWVQITGITTCNPVGVI